MTRRRPARHPDEGVALIEAALVLPLVALLLVGMIEAGFAWRDSNALARSTQQAARTAARLADSELADYEALRALDSALAGLAASSIQRVIVYDAGAGAGDSPPAVCLDEEPADPPAPAGEFGLCNIYSAAQVHSDSPSEFGDGTSCAGKWDQNYCPSDRVRSGDSPDRIGVWVELRFDQVTSVLPGSLSLSRASVYQLEPCIAGASTC